MARKRADCTTYMGDGTVGTWDAVAEEMGWGHKSRTTRNEYESGRAQRTVVEDEYAARSMVVGYMVPVEARKCRSRHVQMDERTRAGKQD